MKHAFFVVEPNRGHLIRIGDLLESGALEPVVDRVLPLSQGVRRVYGANRQHGRAKLVVAVALRTLN